MSFSFAAQLYVFLSAIVLAVSQQRIVGGRDALEGQFPYQVSVRQEGKHVCGGSIISPYSILSAAHCIGYTIDGVYGADKPQMYTILAGITNLSDGGVVRQIASIAVHERFFSLLNDIALLKLAEPLTYSRTIQPISLASSETPVGSPVTVAGWGRTETNGKLSPHLHWSVLQTTSDDECFFEETFLCLASSAKEGVCSGDSGGPAVFNGEVVGVGGFITGDCGAGGPAGYAKVFHYLNWIQEHSDF